MSTRGSECRAFADLVDRHQVEVLRYLRRLTGSAVEADDLFQETFLRALRGFERLGDDANHRAWVYRIATNVFLNHRRSQRRSREVPMADEEPGLPVASAVGQPRDPLERYRRAIARLPRRQRAAFIQRRLLGWTYEDIARVMGGSSTAARSNVYQAARRLRRELS